MGIGRKRRGKGVWLGMQGGSAGCDLYNITQGARVRATLGTLTPLSLQGKGVQWEPFSRRNH